MKMSSVFLGLFSLGTAICLLFIVFPLIKIFISIEPEIFIASFQDSEIMYSIFLSLKCSLVATLFAFFAGIPTAYLFARYSFPFKSFLEAIIDVPVIIPHTAAGIALLSVFGERFFMGKFFGFFGIEFMGTEAGIVIGMMFVSISYLVNHAKEGFKKVDIRLENVSRSLGASNIYTFFHISLPLAKRDIISGIIMMWARGISEFGAVVILAYHPMTSPVLILERFNSYGLKYSKPIAALLIIICIAIFSLLRWINRRK